MGRKQKRVGNLTFEQKKKICIWHDDHPSMTQTELAEKAKKEFVLDKQPGQPTISGIPKNAHRYKNAKDEDLESRRTRKVFLPELDEALANWILCYQTRGIILDGNIVKSKGTRMLDKMGVVGDDRVAFSNGWLQAFQRRRGFRSLMAYGESGPISEQAIPALLEIIRGEVKNYAVADVYNFDEAGLSYKHEFNVDMEKQKRKVLLLIDNAVRSVLFLLPDHPDIEQKLLAGLRTLQIRVRNDLRAETEEALTQTTITSDFQSQN